MEDPKRPGTNPDDVATLVRLAGDSTVSRERMERVRAVAKAEWREKTQRRSRARKIGWVAAAAAVLVAVVSFSTLWDGSGTGPVVSTARVEALTGSATLNVGPASQALAAGDSVPLNGIVATNPGAGVALRLPAGHSLRVDGNSGIELREDSSVALLAGALYLESDPAALEGSIDVHTPFGIVREIGTQFELRLRQRGLRIRLREGAVRLERPDRDYRVEAGTELNVDATGRTETISIAIHGEAWDWVSAMTRVPDFRGRSTHDFLSWMAREKGWTLAFENEAALRAAQDAIVAGNMGSFAPDQALEAVLRASRLEHRVTEGTLVVFRLPSPPS